MITNHIIKGHANKTKNAIFTVRAADMSNIIYRKFNPLDVLAKMACVPHLLGDGTYPSQKCKAHVIPFC